MMTIGEAAGYAAVVCAMKIIKFSEVEQEVDVNCFVLECRISPEYAENLHN